MIFIFAFNCPFHQTYLEGSLGSGDILDIIKVGGTDLRSLNIVVDWVESVGPQGGVLASLGGCEGSVERLLGSGHLGGVLKGGGGGQRQERAESLKCFAISANSGFSRPLPACTC